MSPDFQTSFADDKCFLQKNHNYMSAKLLMKIYETFYNK